jgi:hypothetical protein
MNAISPPRCALMQDHAIAYKRWPCAAVLSLQPCGAVRSRQALLAGWVLAWAGFSPLLVDTASAHAPTWSKAHVAGRACGREPDGTPTSLNLLTDLDRGPYLIAPPDAGGSGASAVDRPAPELLAQRLQSMRDLLKESRGVDPVRLRVRGIGERPQHAPGSVDAIAPDPAQAARLQPGCGGGAHWPE